MRRFETLAVVGLVAIGVGVVGACGGAIAPVEPSPAVDDATSDRGAGAGGGGRQTNRPSGPVREANAVPACAGAECSVQSCLADFVDCDGDPTNGCECPSDSCLPGKLCGKRAFVTSTVSNGNLGGLAGADAKCQERALAAVPPLPGTYKAWLSDDVASPSTRFTKAAIPYRLVTGTRIANNWIDLTDGTLTNPINLDESGAAAPTGNDCGAGEISPWTWTSTAGTDLASAWGPGPDGTNVLANENCANWTDESSPKFTEWGSGNRVTDWAAWCNGGSCRVLAPLFCFQQ